MKNSNHIETIYNIINQKLGAKEARKGTVAILGNILIDLQEAGAEVTEEKIESALREEAEFLEACAKKDVA